MFCYALRCRKSRFSEPLSTKKAPRGAMQIGYAGQRGALPQPQIANSEQINVRWRVNVRMFPNNLPLFLSKRLKKTREGLQKYNYTTKKTVCQIFFTFFVKKVRILRFFHFFCNFPRKITSRTFKSSSRMTISAAVPRAIVPIRSAMPKFRAGVKVAIVSASSSE